MKKVLLQRKDIHSGFLVLVNKDYAIKEEAKPYSLSSFDFKYSDILLDKTALEKLKALLIYIKSEEKIVPVSGFRTLEEQEDIYNSSLKENGIDFTRKYVALPNCSEHQTGLAIDLALASEKIDFIRPAFPNSGICKIFKENMAKFGFIERYKEEKEKITNISKEEWHFRYVGVPHAEIMTDKDLCLEEYIRFLRNYRYNESYFEYKGYRISYLPMRVNSLEILLEDNTLVSGDNVDGFIITSKV